METPRPPALRYAPVGMTTVHLRAFNYSRFLNSFTTISPVIPTEAQRPAVSLAYKQSISRDIYSLPLRWLVWDARRALREQRLRFFSRATQSLYDIACGIKLHRDHTFVFQLREL